MKNNKELILNYKMNLDNLFYCLTMESEDLIFDYKDEIIVSDRLKHIDAYISDFDLYKKKIGVLASIIQDIDHIIKTIDVLNKLESEEQENNG